MTDQTARRMHRVRLVTTMSLATLLSAPISRAQVPVDARQVNPPSNDTSIQEIVVTAQKREETANSIPVSITAVSGAQLEQEGVKAPRDLVRVTPSFNYTDSYVGSPIYTLRGVGFSDISLGGRSTVAVYVDEAPLPFPIETRGANLDLERVEVLKGPQGTLFGQNATGGAIDYIAAKPTSTFKAGLDASYGNYDAVDLDGFVSGPLTDTLTARLSGEHTSMDGWQKSYTTGDHNGAGDFTNGRLLLDWTPSKAFKAQLNVNGWVDHSEVQAGQLIGITPQTAAAAPLVPGLLTYPLSPQTDTAADFTPGQDYHRHNSFVQSNLRLDYDFPRNIELTSITSYSRYTERQLQDIDGTTLSNLNQLTFGSITSESEELRLAGSALNRGHFVLGVDYAHDKVIETDYDDVSQSTVAYTFAPFALAPFATYRDTDNQDSTTTAAFASGDFAINDAVKVYGGARYTRADDKFNGCTSDIGNGVTAGDFSFFDNYLRGLEGLAPNPPIPPGGCITANSSLVPGLVVGSLNQSNVAWRGGVEWTPLQRTLLYANVSKGYKAGGFPDLAATTASQFQPATQESVVAYEVGLKTTLVDRTLQLNGAVFHYDYRDKQILGRVLDPIFGPVLRLINVPKSEITGAELQAVWTPLRGLVVTAGGSYIGSRIENNFTNYDPNGVVTDFNGGAFPNTPKWQLVANADYRFDLSPSFDGLIGGNVTYQSSTNSQLGDLPLLAVKAYTLVDLRAGLEDKSRAWRLMFWVRNLGDEYYWTAANRDLDTSVRFTGLPRTFGATLSYRYQ